MKMRDILSAETKQQLEKEKSPSTKEADPLTRRDWEEIMGVRKDTYKRTGGRIRRKQ
ncbi:MULTISPECIES: hypothetical protein [Bacillus]|uniref:hypothetical protein n=1 Tax=Bacillus TaxID=1386 RepID=UPI0006A576D6|nr:MULTISPECIES: hypothetical protein [Bacillus]MBL3612961.1 hypothetical protein [Bacillus sp. RHFS18]KAF6543782.1 hypothetical protein G9F51_19205 [Bacillus sp. EKM207B]KAF6543858.1 hypothetical protein G9F50_19135 [Bacillus sp. EKM206B]KOC80085.1 phosphoadenosine phosphosulfate sulfotransferase [Bacillus velezensis]KSW04635.1 phosphoadenosine phosphosulfate sulfotransferase [Bacillus velezensis]